MLTYADDGTIDIQIWDTPNQERLSDIVTKAHDWSSFSLSVANVLTGAGMSGDREETSWSTRDLQHKTQGGRPLCAYCWWSDNQNTDLSEYGSSGSFSTALKIRDLVWQLSHLFWSNLFKHIFVI